MRKLPDIDRPPETPLDRWVLDLTCCRPAVEIAAQCAAGKNPTTAAQYGVAAGISLALAALAALSPAERDELLRLAATINHN